MKIKVLIGIVISGVFIYLTYHQVNFQEMVESLKTAQYIWLIPALIFMFISHWFRAVRWRYIIEPIKSVKVHPIFSALMIGYAANNVFPLRMGEFLRAYALGKSQNISKSATFATVIIERFILDFLALLVVLAITIVLFPTLLPSEIKNGGYVILALTLAVIALIIFLVEKPDDTIRILKAVLPSKLFNLVENVIPAFINGCMVFKKSEHYLRITFLTILVWALYIASVYVSFFVFDFQNKYGLDVKSSLVVLVFATFGIMIPSSPGYVGTYHFFCALSLLKLHVPDGEAKSFALISHLINVLPISIVGLAYFWKENLHFSEAVAEKHMVEHEAEEPQLPTS